MDTMTVTVSNISCEHCQRAIEGAIGALHAGQSVRVEVPSKTVQVRYDPAHISHESIAATLDDEGYPVAS
jgi:copper chaperone